MTTRADLQQPLKNIAGNSQRIITAINRTDYLIPLLYPRTHGSSSVPHCGQCGIVSVGILSSASIVAFML